MATDHHQCILSPETLNRLKEHLLAALALHTKLLHVHHQTLDDMLSGRLRTSLPVVRARFDGIRMLEQFPKRVVKEPWFPECEREWGEGLWEEAEERGREGNLEVLVEELEEVRRALFGEGSGKGMMR